MLPDYISKAVPNPASNRAPWYKNTAPTYAGVFLWIVFYKQIANGTLDRAGVGLCLARLTSGGHFELRAVLQGSGHDGDADGSSALRGGQFNIRHKGRLSYAGFVDGCSAGWLDLCQRVRFCAICLERRRFHGWTGQLAI